MDVRLARGKGYRYSAQDKRDICWLVLNGWPAVDVARAYGVAVWPRAVGLSGAKLGFRTTVYQRVDSWMERFGPGGALWT